MTEKSRREAEIMRVEAIQDEMAAAVRLLGGEGTAKDQNRNASRESGLSHTIIERLRWKKIKRVPADLADAMREAVERHKQKELSRARHELLIAKHQAAILAARLSEIDPDFYGPEIGALRGQSSSDG